jgi:hypothetical protein
MGPEALPDHLSRLSRLMAVKAAIRGKAVVGASLRVRKSIGHALQNHPDAWQ